MTETKVRILDTAERLIAEHGLDVSLRTITAEAGVNLAAVNYHFQSKEALLEALVCRRFDGLNTRRLELLAAVEAAHPEGLIPLEEVLEAFLGPMLDLKSQAPTHHRQLMGRLYTMPDDLIRRIFDTHMRPAAQRFVPAFRRAAPWLTEEEVSWRMILSIGSAVHLMSWSKIVSVVNLHGVDLGDPAEVLHQAITFAAAGFRGRAEQSQGGTK